jgi:AcrR family transcriptional regulator
LDYLGIPEGWSLAGLREAKKERLRADVLAAVDRILRAQGLGGFRVRDVLARVAVSEATLFHYFPSKDALLSAWASALLDEAFRGRWAEPGRRAARLRIRELVRELAGRVARDRAVLGPVWERVRLPSSGSRPSARAALVVEVLRRAQERQEIRGDLPAGVLGELLLAAIERTLGAWLARPERPAEPFAEALAARLQATADLVLDGARKRNERVRAAAVAGARAPRP